MLQPNLPSEPNPGANPPAGHPRSVVFYLETFLAIIEAGISSQVYTFWLYVIRTELQTIADEPIRQEALRQLQEIGKGGQWLARDFRSPGESLPLILDPIRRLIEYLDAATPAK